MRSALMPLTSTVSNGARRAEPLSAPPGGARVDKRCSSADLPLPGVPTMVRHPGGCCRSTWTRRRWPLGGRKTPGRVPDRSTRRAPAPALPWATTAGCGSSAESRRSRLYRAGWSGIRVPLLDHRVDEILTRDQLISFRPPSPDVRSVGTVRPGPSRSNRCNAGTSRCWRTVSAPRQTASQTMMAPQLAVVRA